MNLSCPLCNHKKSDTLETRKITDTKNSMMKQWKGYKPNDCIVRRRHECRSCGHRWSTLQLSFDDLNKLRSLTVNKSVQKTTEAIQSLLEKFESEKHCL
jgi:transcriptional regulator NrdR family protein